MEATALEATPTETDALTSTGRRKHMLKQIQTQRTIQNMHLRIGLILFAIII